MAWTIVLHISLEPASMNRCGTQSTHYAAGV
jgi:hypothetical protein